MRKILKHFLINSFALYVISQVVGGMSFAQGNSTLLIAATVLTLATLIIKPIINVLLLPLNLITFGLFKWLSYTITLFLVTMAVSDFKIAGFHFGGFSSYWIDIPAINVEGLLGLVLFSLLISLFSSVFFWIMK